MADTNTVSEDTMMRDVSPVPTDNVTSDKTFKELNLSDEMVKGLIIGMEFEKPSNAQSLIFPMISTSPHKNLFVRADNGTGKTTCAMVGMLSRVDLKLAAPQALCICSTRELAIQNQEMLLEMEEFTGITSELGIPADTANYIPVPKRAPVTAQVIIGTPGTINKWIAAKKLDTYNLEILVFDDVDHMLDESADYKDESVKIMKEIVKRGQKCQVLLFYTTFNKIVEDFELKVMKVLSIQKYNRLCVKKKQETLDRVKHYKVQVPDEHSKIMVIKYKIMDLAKKVRLTIIFVKEKESARMLHEALVKYGYEVTAIHGARKQEDRDKIIKEFKDGLTHVLISTDVLARGFNHPKINLVINYDLPVVDGKPSEPNSELYSHRIGRAGRFGRKGAVFNLLCGEGDETIMEKIEGDLNQYVAEVPLWISDEDFKDALEKAGLK